MNGKSIGTSSRALSRIRVAFACCGVYLVQHSHCRNRADGWPFQMVTQRIKDAARPIEITFTTPPVSLSALSTMQMARWANMHAPWEPGTRTSQHQFRCVNCSVVTMQCTRKCCSSLWGVFACRSLIFAMFYPWRREMRNRQRKRTRMRMRTTRSALSALF